MFLETSRPLRRRDVWMRQSWRHCSFNESDRMVARAMLLERVHRRSAPPWPCCLCCTALDSMPQFKPGRDSISRSTHTHTLLSSLLSFRFSSVLLLEKKKKEKKTKQRFLFVFLFECGLEWGGFWSNINYTVYRKRKEIESRLAIFARWFILIFLSKQKFWSFFENFWSKVVRKLINFIELFDIWYLKKKLKYIKYLQIKKKKFVGSISGEILTR